ncbi:hypothetical protein [Undibacterium sp. SXout20W]|uniref:hypothetical protein n=1 Tax=Undibacterium sp. SXout20W TaxID=3413051 RepID=UPI003BF27726
MNFHRQRGISLVWVAIISMLVAAASMCFLYTARYGHLPFQEAWARWSQSGTVIGHELQKAAGVKELHLPGQDNAGVPPPVTIQSGVRRCVINGKTVFSDTECTDKNPTSVHMKLSDTQGFVHPKPVTVDDRSSSGSDKMIDKMIERAER